MFRMIVKTQSVQDGKPTNTVEYVRHIQEDDLAARREAARQSAPRGAVRTIRVVNER